MGSPGGYEILHQRIPERMDGLKDRWMNGRKDGFVSTKTRTQTKTRGNEIRLSHQDFSFPYTTENIFGPLGYE